MKIRYIQRRSGSDLETVDEFPYNNWDDRTYFRRMLAEYRLSDPSADFYGSSRACRHWHEK